MEKIKKSMKKFLLVIFLWFIFTIGCLLAPIFAILLLVLPKNRYIKHFVLAADRMCAAMLGFSGRVTLSTECLHKLRWLHDALNFIDTNHCEETAINEGAYCRLSDRQLGEK